MKLKLKEVRPRLFLSLLVTVATSVASLYIVSMEHTNLIIESISYIIYACAVCGIVSTTWAAILVWREKNPIRKFYRLAIRYKITRRIVEEHTVRVMIGIYISLLINIVFACIRAGMAIMLHSNWFAILAAYYSMLSFTRFFLVIHHQKVRRMKSKQQQNIQEWRSFRITGGMLALTSIILIRYVLHMVMENKGYYYEGMLIYVVAVYDFYCLGYYIVYAIRMYKKHGPTVRAIKTISFCTSLVSLLSLQTAIFATFGKDTTIKMQCLMNGITGMITCFSILLIGCYMYCKGRKEEGVIDDKDISGRR